MNSCSINDHAFPESLRNCKMFLFDGEKFDLSKRSHILETPTQSLSWHYQPKENTDWQTSDIAGRLWIDPIKESKQDDSAKLCSTSLDILPLFNLQSKKANTFYGFAKLEEKFCENPQDGIVDIAFVCEREIL